MEKSTISALIVAGGTMLSGIIQVLALRAAKKRKRQEPDAGPEVERIEQERG